MGVKGKDHPLFEKKDEKRKKGKENGLLEVDRRV
jgi:hypothetical protein